MKRSLLDEEAPTTPQSKRTPRGLTTPESGPNTTPHLATSPRKLDFNLVHDEKFTQKTPPRSTATSDEKASSSAKKPKRPRGKKTDEADLLELKPRKRGSRRPVVDLPKPSTQSVWAEPSEWNDLLQIRLARTLRPKFRRWCSHEWFYSLVDHAWYQNSDFRKVLKDCGLGGWTKLTRKEWCCVRILQGKVRRFSKSFIGQQRADLQAHRVNVRALRRMQGSFPTRIETKFGLYRTPQLAVGQRVTAIHPKDRYIYCGTILCPDGDDYKIQFDHVKQGVTSVPDYCVMPLVDGTIGLDFASQRGLKTQSVSDMTDLQCVFNDDWRRRVAAGEHVKLSLNEMKLIAEIMRLLERQEFLMNELNRVCGMAEEGLRQAGHELAECGLQIPGLVVPRDATQTHVEVTAAQQRQLGQVPPPPLLPSLKLLLEQAPSASEEFATQLLLDAARWQAEIHWLKREATTTVSCLNQALCNMRPFAQRICIAFGTAAPEPQAEGLNLAECTLLRQSIEDSTSAIMMRAMRESDHLPPSRTEELTSAACELMLRLKAWAEAPRSPSDCRFSLIGAVERLRPVEGSNYGRFNAIVSRTQQLMSLVSGARLSCPEKELLV